jgi:hypothetical protein
MNDSDNEYMDYAEKVIAEYVEARDLVDKRTITGDDVNYHMVSYLKVNDVLIQESEDLETEYANEKEQYQIWFDSHYIEARQKLNPLDLSAQKWAGAEEIRSYVRTEHKDEYLVWREKLNFLEGKVNKIKRIRESYKTFSFILQTLSDNMRSQMHDLNLPNRMNNGRSVVK